ncbi:MAG: archaetidylserine decarboxylase [Puniceicoccales bacterium]|jgi:phosphatidylserine decarboxylase|nr:archaetidylserine decarboxylase [Puniceicoccales bacterium]
MQFFNRYTGTLQEEKVPSESILRWLYKTKVGRYFLQTFVRNAWMSKIVGCWMNTRLSKYKIHSFVKNYGICLDDFEKKLNEYEHFNDFFCRKFKVGKRNFNNSEEIICFPTDGRHLGFNHIEDSAAFFIKGESLCLKKLLGTSQSTHNFKDASMIISRLSPVDYHRFHFPIEGIPSQSRCVNGYLYSVHPLALMKNVLTFTQNKRWVCILRHEILGDVALIEIGAMGVGSTVQTYPPNRFVKKGEEKGYFLFGGSTVITLLNSKKVKLADDLLEQTRRGYELYAYCGDVLGRII